ncbi:MAG: trypsin-like peptidase domain-containing protein [Pseudonocardia sp.]|nr:trypsin-like peptidase domain-containing protein [Pseudonocardia sp.]
MTSARAAAAVVVGVALLVSATACSTTAPSVPPPSDVAAPALLPTGPGLADVVARVMPSVVTVATPTGVGSGVVYRSDVVLTNHHVVAGATEVRIDYADGTSSPGTVLATDPTTDLAVIRTVRTDLPTIEFRTELPRPGETVLAIGSPLGFEGTVTAGIVSALNRQIPGSAAQSRALVDLIQVDAAISPGNSGGALIDAAGRVIGINEAYIPPSAGAVSIGFAIPAATAVDIADQLLADGAATHPYLGVSLGRLTPEISRRLGVVARSGALVLAVAPDGPAAAAGARPGDVVVALADQDVGSIEDLLGALRGTEPGQRTTLTVLRGGDPVELTITIGSRTR